MKSIKLIKTSLIALFFALALPNPTFAQEGSTQAEKIEIAKVSFITDALELTGEEAGAFWEEYNEYTTQKKAIKAKYKADGNTIAKEQEELDLKKSYYQLFEDILGKDRINKLYEAEKDFRAMLIKLIKDQQ